MVVLNTANIKHSFFYYIQVSLTNTLYHTNILLVNSCNCIGKNYHNKIQKNYYYNYFTLVFTLDIKIKNDIIMMKVIEMKKKVLVLFGGVSSEHDVSLNSASSVMKNIPAEKYDVVPMGITKDGRCFVFNGSPDLLPESGWLADESLLEPAVISCDRSHHGIIRLASGKVEYIDVVFPVLHGKNGEDGTIQGIFEMAGIPYVGCSPLAGAMCMDKAVTNTLADAAGIDGAKWAAFTETEYRNGRVDLAKIEAKLGYPIFVKPANAGSSVGISKAHNHYELVEALDIAFRNDYKAVLEETLVGREIECAVMGNAEPVASCIGEILPTTEFYDFDAKYIDNSTGLAIPADLPADISEKVRAAAINAYKTLGCEGLSRVDFFLCNDGRICLNEINTLPGFTSISMFPKLFGQVGVPYSELLDRLIEYAEERAK